MTARMEVFLSRPCLRRLPALPGAEYRRLAQKLGVDFTAAGDWDILMLFDGILFTPEEHWGVPWACPGNWRLWKPHRAGLPHLRASIPQKGRSTMLRKRPSDI